MRVQFTVTVDGREVGGESRQVSGTAARIEEQIREMQQRTGRMALPPALAQLSVASLRQVCLRRAGIICENAR